VGRARKMKKQALEMYPESKVLLALKKGGAL
jgi:hypothetical protein